MPNKSSMQLVLGSEENKVIYIDESFYELQIHKLELDVELDICFPSLRINRMLVICVYEPKQKLFWWDYSFINKDSSIDMFNYILKKWFFHVLDNKIVGFKLFTSQILYIESAEQYETFHEACTYLMSKLEKKLLEKIAKYYENIEEPYLYQFIYLRRYIDGDFFYPTGKCLYSLRNPQVSMKTLRHKDKWKIELEGINKRQATVVLNNDYEILEVWLDGVKISPSDS